jgi:hypothetical protein
MATSTSITTIISIGTRTGTLTAAKLARATSGNITRNIAEMRRMGTGKRQTNLVVRVRVERVTDPVVAERELGPAAELALQVAALEIVRAAVQEHDPVVAVLEPVPAAAVLEHGQAAAKRERVPVAAVLEHDPAAAKREQGPVAVELERVPVVAVPVRDPVALLPKTKSVTAAHHPGQVPRLAAVEDLAAAAETTREPAVIEAVTAWAAAV